VPRDVTHEHEAESDRDSGDSEDGVLRAPTVYTDGEVVGLPTVER